MSSDKDRRFNPPQVRLATSRLPLVGHVVVDGGHRAAKGRYGQED